MAGETGLPEVATLSRAPRRFTAGDAAEAVARGMRRLVLDDRAGVPAGPLRKPDDGGMAAPARDPTLEA